MVKRKIKGEMTWTDVVYTRIFYATRQQLFKAWTDAGQVAAWWGPHGFTNPVCNWNACAKGEMYIQMTAPDGMVFPMTGQFHEIAAPERVVFTSRAFEISPGDAQLEILNTVIFTEVNGGTKLTLEATVMKASPAASAALATMHEGWKQSLDRLEQYLRHKSSIKNN